MPVLTSTGEPDERMKPPTITAIAKHLGITQGRASQLKKEGLPVNSLRAAKLWKENRAARRTPTNASTAKLHPSRKGRPKNPAKLSKTGDSLADILANTIATAEVAFESYHGEVVRGGSNQSILLSNHTKAAEAVARLERMVREEQERRNILVPRAAIVDSCRRALNVMLRRLRKLPDETGPQCEGRDALQIVTILQRAVDEVLLAGQQAMNEL